MTFMMRLASRLTLPVYCMLRFLILLLLTATATFGQQLTIGVGTSANDGTGDPARTAFQKVNTNFTAVFLNVLTVSNTVTANTANITTVSNSVGVVAANLTTVSNTVTVNTGNLTTVSNSVGTVAANLTTVSNSLTGKINAQTGTTYSFLIGDAGKLTTFSNASSVAVTLGFIGPFADGTVFHAKNIGAGVVTITPTGATIDFAATLILTKGQSASIFSDGTNYRTTLLHPNISSELVANTTTFQNPKSLTTKQTLDIWHTSDAVVNPTNYVRLQASPEAFDWSEVGTGALGGFRFRENGVTKVFYEQWQGNFYTGPSAFYGWSSTTPTYGNYDTSIKRKSAGKVSASTGLVDDTGQFSSINGLSIGSIFTQTADATVANTVTETSILGTGSGTKTVAAGAINTIGRTLRIQVRGMISVNVGSPTLTVRFKIQGVTISTGVIAVNAASSNAFSIDELVTVRTTGASGTFASNGEFSYQDTSNGSPSVGLLQPGTSTTDLTTSKTIDITVQWSAANAASTLTSQVATIEILN